MHTMCNSRKFAWFQPSSSLQLLQSMIRCCVALGRSRTQALLNNLGSKTLVHPQFSSLSCTGHTADVITFSAESGSLNRSRTSLRHFGTQVMSKARTALDEMANADGAFKRKDSVFRDWIEEGGKYPPEGESVSWRVTTGWRAAHRSC